MPKFQKPYGLGDVVLVYRKGLMYLGFIEASQKLAGEARYSVWPIGSWFRAADLALVTPCDEMSWDMVRDQNDEEEEDIDFGFPSSSYFYIVEGADISAEVDEDYASDDLAPCDF
jgi:hypothetical protein